jgi:hypothetical protein
MPWRRAAASISIWKLPLRSGTYTCDTRSSGFTLTFALASTVASAAGPHWYSVCGKNGTLFSSARGGISAGRCSRSDVDCGAISDAQPESSAQARTSATRTGLRIRCMNSSG